MKLEIEIELIADLMKLIVAIQSSHMSSISSIDSHYLPQLEKRKIDELADKFFLKQGAAEDINTRI